MAQIILTFGLGKEKIKPQREITTAVFQWMRENRDMCEVVLGEYGDRSFCLLYTSRCV